MKRKVKPQTPAIIIGISHQDFASRMAVISKILALRKQGVNVVVGLERITNSDNYKVIAKGLADTFGQKGIPDFERLMGSLLSQETQPVARSNLIDYLTNITLARLCEQSAIPCTQLDSEELLVKIDKEITENFDPKRAQKSVEEITNKYELARIEAMVGNIAKLVDKFPQGQRVLVVNIVGMAHIPTLTYKLRQDGMEVFPAMLLSPQASREIRGDFDKIKLWIVKQVQETVADTIELMPETRGGWERGDSDYRMEILKISLEEPALQKVIQASDPVFDKMIQDTLKFVGLGEADKMKIFKDAAILIRKSDVSNLEMLLNDNPWLVDYQDSVGNNLLHICTNGYALTSKEFGGINETTKLCNQDEQVKAALDRRCEVAKFLIERGVRVDAKNNIKEKKPVPKGNGESPVEILTRIKEESGRSDVDKDFAGKLLDAMIPKTATSQREETEPLQKHSQVLVSFI